MGIESLQALPALLFNDEALMRLVGFKAQQVWHGVRQRGAATWQGPCTGGAICPDALADTIVKLNVRDLEAWFHHVIRALAKAGMLAAKVTGIVDATDLETTAMSEGCGKVTRQRRSTDTRGKAHAIEVTVYGGELIVLIEAGTQIPVAAPVVPIQAHETLSLWALVTQARTTLAGHARQKTARAVRVHIMLALLMFALATAYHLPCAQADTGNEPVGWQRWRRQPLPQTRDHVIVFAQDGYGIFHLAEYPLLLGVKRKDVPCRIGTHQEILAKFGLTAHG